MSYSEFIANANTAFGGGQFEAAIGYVTNARIEAKDNNEKAETFVLEGKAYMSMERALEAVNCFSSAASLVPDNGNVLFLLGYAQAMAGDTAKALKSFTRALENNCDTELKGQIYKHSRYLKQLPLALVCS